MRKSKTRRQTRFQMLKKKYYRDTRNILAISSGLRDSFERAYTVASASIKSEIEEAKTENLILSEKANSIQFEEDTPPSEDELQVFDELGSNYWTIHSSEDSLLSLSETRILFLFKTIEKAIKEMAGIAYPKINKRDFFRWALVISHLKSNGVEIKNLNGYQEVNQLRIVNNNIKHSQEINAETKKIRYWEDEDEFTYKNLEIFYNNIKETVIAFMETLGKSIISATYELSDEKLEEMSKEIFDRLDSKRVKKLIVCLQKKL